MMVLRLERGADVMKEQADFSGLVLKLGLGDIEP
jgi:hypothetical protein